MLPPALLVQPAGDVPGVVADDDVCAGALSGRVHLPQAPALAPYTPNLARSLPRQVNGKLGFG